MVTDRVKGLLGEALPSDPDEQTHELTIEEAVQVATMLQRSNRLDEADLVYKRILDAAPENPTALHFAGVLAHQLGLHDEAVRRIEKSLALVPSLADWHNNYGIALQVGGRLQDAIAAFRQAIALDPAHANAYSNMGVLLRATDKPEEQQHGRAAPRDRQA